MTVSTFPVGILFGIVDGCSYLYFFEIVWVLNVILFWKSNFRLQTHRDNIIFCLKIKNFTIHKIIQIICKSESGFEWSAKPLIFSIFVYFPSRSPCFLLTASFVVTISNSTQSQPRPSALKVGKSQKYKLCTLFSFHQKNRKPNIHKYFELDIFSTKLIISSLKHLNSCRFQTWNERVFKNCN